MCNEKNPNCAQWCSIQYFPILQCFVVLSEIWIFDILEKQSLESRWNYFKLKII